MQDFQEYSMQLPPFDDEGDKNKTETFELQPEPPASSWLQPSDVADVIALSPLLVIDPDLINAKRISPFQKPKNFFGQLEYLDRIIATSWSRDHAESKKQIITTHFTPIIHRYINSLINATAEEYIYAAEPTRAPTTDPATDNEEKILLSDNPRFMQPLNRAYQQFRQSLIQGEVPDYHSMVCALQKYETEARYDRRSQTFSIDDQDPWKKHTIILNKIIQIYHRQNTQFDEQWIQEMCSALNEVHMLYHMGEGIFIGKGQSIEYLMHHSTSSKGVPDLNRLFVEKDLDAYGLPLPLVQELVLSECSPQMQNLYQATRSNHPATQKTEQIRNSDQYRKAVLAQLIDRVKKLPSQQRKAFVDTFVWQLQRAIPPHDPLRNQIDTALEPLSNLNT